MSTYAVGDIQGCLPKLQELLGHANFSGTDTLWCAGDLVNRGPQSLETLRFIRQLGDRAKVVLGNHDLHLLACWHGQRQIGNKDTFSEILSAPDCEDLLTWLQKQPLLHRDDTLGYAMVHAGIPPIWSLDTAQQRAQEVEQHLQSPEASLFFAAMYSNEPSGWSETLHGMTRLRVITNYFTRMRFCQANGNLEFASKCGPDTPPKGFLPWFSYSHHRCQNERILFGHWAALEGNTSAPNFIGLDTGCVWGGKLSMIRLEDSERFSIECEC